MGEARATWLRGSEGQLTDLAGLGIPAARAAAVGTNPDIALERFKQGHDSRGTDAVSIAWGDWNRLQSAGRGEYLKALRHRADPEVVVAIAHEGHDALVAEGSGVVQDRVEIGGLAGCAVEQGEAAAERADPDLVVGGIRERRHQPTAQPVGAVAAQLPTARVPATDTACAGPAPQQPGP